MWLGFSWWNRVVVFSLYLKAPADYLNFIQYNGMFINNACGPLHYLSVSVTAVASVHR